MRWDRHLRYGKVRYLRYGRQSPPRLSQPLAAYLTVVPVGLLGPALLTKTGRTVPSTKGDFRVTGLPTLPICTYRNVQNLAERQTSWWRGAAVIYQI